MTKGQLVELRLVCFAFAKDDTPYAQCFFSIDLIQFLYPDMRFSEEALVHPRPRWPAEVILLSYSMFRACLLACLPACLLA